MELRAKEIWYKDLDLTNVDVGTQFLMLTKNGKYKLGKVIIERYGRKIVSNNYQSLFYYQLTNFTKYEMSYIEKCRNEIDEFISK